MFRKLLTASWVRKFLRLMTVLLVYSFEHTHPSRVMRPAQQITAGRTERSHIV